MYPCAGTWGCLRTKKSKSFCMGHPTAQRAHLTSGNWHGVSGSKLVKIAGV